jgi:deoxyhypusine synthase
VLGLEERGHDFFVQFTDARPDTGGLSGATPAEAVSWGKIDPDELPRAIVCYTDSTIALPLVTAYVLNQCLPRSLKRLYDQRQTLLDTLQKDYLAAKDQPVSEISQEKTATYPCGTLIKG